MARTTTAPKSIRFTACHCCRADAKIIDFAPEFVTLHDKPVCSTDCMIAVNESLLSDPPELLSELLANVA